MINTISLQEFSSDHHPTEMEVVQTDFDGQVSPTWPFTIEDGYTTPPPAEAFRDDISLDCDMQEPQPDDLNQDHSNEPLVLLRPDQFVALPCPVVDSLHSVTSLRSHMMAAKVRSVLLWQQEESWADDEILWHLQQCIVRSGKSHVAVLDPLLASSAVRDYRPKLIHDWFVSLDVAPSSIVSAVCVDGHWSPFIWTWTDASLVANSWDIPSCMPHAGQAPP